MEAKGCMSYGAHERPPPPSCAFQGPLDALFISGRGWGGDIYHGILAEAQGEGANRS